MISSSLLFMCFVTICVESKIVVTDNGRILGKLVNEYGASYYSYQGIPYAESPTGALRFLPPVPRKPWSGILNATVNGPVCPQAESEYNQRKQMTEDCLVLNVYVPAKKKKHVPVLVFFHGGAYKINSGNPDYMHGPQLFIKHDVIVVTVNYRLGALGFLSLGVENASGNAGLKDGLLALKWIQANIDKFGGDRNKITISGTSSGSNLANYLLLTEQSRGLFQQAILISGGVLSSRFLSKHPIELALALAEYLGLPTNDTDALIQRLRDIDVFDLVDAQQNMLPDDRSLIKQFAPFVPCIEIESPHAILTRDPREIIKSGIPQNVPVLAGFNAQEGIYNINMLQNNSILDNDAFQSHLEQTIPSDIEYPADSKESKDLVNAIRDFYFKESNETNNVYNIVNVISDTQYIYGVDAWIKLHKQREDSNVVYYYVFNFDGELNWSKINYDIKIPGTAHSDEVGYIFVTAATKDKLDDIDSRSQQMMNVILTMFTNFVKFGNPTPNEDCDKKWPESGKERYHLLLNDQPTRELFTAIPDRLQFWSDVYDQYYSYVNNGGTLESKIVP